MSCLLVLGERHRFWHVNHKRSTPTSLYVHVLLCTCAHKYACKCYMHVCIFGTWLPDKYAPISSARPLQCAVFLSSRFETHPSCYHYALRAWMSACILLRMAVHTMWGLWRVTCCMWHVACGIWHVACGMWRAECCMCQAACCMLHVACGTDRQLDKRTDSRPLE